MVLLYADDFALGQDRVKIHSKNVGAAMDIIEIRFGYAKRLIDKINENKIWVKAVKTLIKLPWSSHI